MHACIKKTHTNHHTIHQEACRFYMIESGFALVVVFLINVLVIAVSGLVCNSSNLSPDNVKSCQDLSLNRAFLLRNVLGNWSSKLFAIALLASGQSSTITGTYAGQYIMQAMADLIEQMGVTIENHQKQFEESRAKFDAEVLKCSELSVKLDATHQNLDQTSKLLANTKEEIKRCQYAIREWDFIILEQKKAENALAHQACVLRVDLEKSLKDNASLFSKIGREDKLNANNRSIVDNYQANLTKEIRTLCNTVATSVTQQNEHLQCIEKFCNSFSDVNVKYSDVNYLKV